MSSGILVEKKAAKKETEVHKFDLPSIRKLMAATLGVDEDRLRIDFDVQEGVCKGFSIMVDHRNRKDLKTAAKELSNELRAIFGATAITVATNRIDTIVVYDHIDVSLPDKIPTSYQGYDVVRKLVGEFEL